MIRINGLVYVAGAFRLDVSLGISRGEYFVIMGPTGSGKTALVECLAGLRQPSSGTIEIFGRDATRLEPRRRGVGYVPQDYALFAHRTVRGNVAFAPQVQRWPREETERSVREAARLLEIEPLLDRRIGGLSGGERQRVALARALVARPQVLVLDEPVSALDEPTREAVCGELRRLQRELGLTIVHVSHNLEEAFSVADRAAVMRAGRVEQVGRIDDLMRRPDNEAVARFMRCVNVFAGEAAGDGPAPGTTRVKADGFEFLVPGARRGRVVFVVRPENVLVRRTGEGAAGAGVAAAAARVTRSEDRGAYVRLQLESFRPLVAHLPAKAFAALGIRDGGAAEVLFPPDGVHVLPR